MEGAGKGEVVNALDEWLDARGVNVYAFWDEPTKRTASACLAILARDAAPW